MEIFCVENLSFSYPQSDEKVLSNISFSVNEGEFFVICGESGCGKTTLLRLLKPQLAPNGKKEGGAFYKGKSIADLPQEETAFKIGFVSQIPENQIVTDTVMHELAFTLENMGLKSDEINVKISETATYFGLTDIINSKTASLSGGQLQLLNLASAAVSQPDVLILDEPTSQLDPISAKNLITILNKLNRDTGLTVIMAEHRLERLFPIADRVAVMENGKLIAASAPEKIPSILKSLSDNHRMLAAMPAAAQMYLLLCEDEKCPLDIREGRRIFKKYCAGDNPNVFEKSNVLYPDRVLQLKNIFFRYEKNSPDVIKNLDLSVNRGEIFSIVGANGSGKSTLLSIIASHLKPYRGKVKAFESVAFMPQNPKYLFVKDTLAEDFSAVCNDERLILSTAEKFKITHLLNRHPFDLSGGELQRAAFAKLMLTAPKILLLDEPTKGCDAFAKKAIASMLSKLSQSGMTIILVTHDLDFSADVSTRCALLFNGTLLSEGEPHDFFCGKSFYTTSANKISRQIKDGIITTDELLRACKESRGELD